MLSLVLSAVLTISSAFFQQSVEVAAKFDRAVELQRREELGRARRFFVLYYLGYAQDKLGNLTDARRNVEDALRVNPELSEANKLYAKILFRQNQVKAALEPIERVVKRQPLDSEARYLRARIYQRLGRAEDAKREFAEVDLLKARERSGENPRPKEP